MFLVLWFDSAGLINILESLTNILYEFETHSVTHSVVLPERSYSKP